VGRARRQQEHDQRHQDGNQRLRPAPVEGPMLAETRQQVGAGALHQHQVGAVRCAAPAGGGSGWVLVHCRAPCASSCVARRERRGGIHGGSLLRWLMVLYSPVLVGVAPLCLQAQAVECPHGTRGEPVLHSHTQGVERACGNGA
jgi:hypothetical protein